MFNAFYHLYNNDFSILYIFISNKIINKLKIQLIYNKINKYILKMLNSYYTNNLSSEHFKKKIPSNSTSKSQVVTRSKTVGNNRNKLIKKKITSPIKNNSLQRRRNFSNNNQKLSQSNSTNKHIQFKKQASSNNNNDVNKTMGNISINKNNNSFIKNNDIKNKSVYLSNEKNRLLNSSQSTKTNIKKKNNKINVNIDCSQFTNESLGISTINDVNYGNNINNEIAIKEKFKNTLLNSGNVFNINNNNIKEQPLKLYKENLISHNNNISNYQNENNNSSKFTKLNTNNNSLSNSINLSNNKNTFNILAREQFSKQINEINISLEKNLNENKTNSKSQKYNTIKHAFEDLLRLLQNNNSKVNNTNLINLLQKLLYGYHEVVNAFSIENRELKQLNFSLNEKNEKMDKLLLESMSVMNEKNRELKFLKKKISTISLETDANTNHITSNENENLIVFEKGSINEKIFNLNKNNLDDLDALYFFDKIEMKNKRSFSQTVPLLRIGKDELKKLNRNDNKNKGNIIHHIYNKSENNMNENYKKNFSNFKMIKSQF